MAAGSGETDNGKRLAGFIKSFSLYALKHNLMVVAYYLIRLYFLTIRIESTNEAAVLQHLQKGGKLIVALWHQRIITGIEYAGRFGSYRPSVMISSSRDGDLIASVFGRMNFRPVRGSSSLNGKKALLAMVEDLNRHPLAVQILDGPRGPRGVIKPGLIVMAEQSRVPIIPVYVSASRAWVLRSWDRCLIPKPFSKVMIHWDQPIAVPGEMDEQAFEEFRLGVERRMLENQRRYDRCFGWENLI